MEEELVIIVVESRFKKKCKDLGVRAGGGFLKAFNEAMHKVLEASAKRCKDSNRKTLNPEDI